MNTKFYLCVKGVSNLGRGLIWFFMLLLIGCQSNTLPDRVDSGSNVEVGEQITSSRKLRERIMADPYRPIYHFVAPEGNAYPFDPNGAIFWNGKYHLGFIYQSLERGKREHFWGHAVSTDLLHWRLYPDMLDVKEGDQEIGIFSGGTFLSREGVPHVIYHGWGADANMVAYSTDDDLIEWIRFEGNPVSKTPAKGDPMYEKFQAWDPEAWYDSETDYYYQITGGYEKAGYFRSKDMVEWEFLGDLIDQGNRMRYDFEDLSCPDFFSVGNKHMLLFISHNLGSQYYLGDFSNGQFTPEQHGRMNWPGGTFFAPEQLVDDKGRNIIWGWILERRPELLKWTHYWEEEEKNAQRFLSTGWSGIMSLPRVVSLSDNNEVLVSPARELTQLRHNGAEIPAFTLAPNAKKELPIRGKSLEILVELKVASEPFGIKVFSDLQSKEETLIKYDPQAKELIIDFSKSAESGEGQVRMEPNCMGDPLLEGFTEPVSEQRAPFELKQGEVLQLNIFLDRSMIEVFANGRLCMTQVVYPELEDSDRVEIFSTTSALEVISSKIWSMAPTNFY